MNGIIARLLDMGADLLNASAVIARRYADEFAIAQQRVDNVKERR